MNTPTSYAKGYRTLALIVGLIAISAWFFTWREHAGIQVFMRFFMVGYFLIFGVFKLLDLKGFALTFSGYDLLAQRIKAYGYIYPFMEVALGILLLRPSPLSSLLIFIAVLSSFGAFGVLLGLKHMKGMRCACLGTIVPLPLTTISLLENVLMATMAIVMFLLW